MIAFMIAVLLFTLVVIFVVIKTEWSNRQILWLDVIPIIFMILVIIAATVFISSAIQAECDNKTVARYKLLDKPVPTPFIAEYQIDKWGQKTVIYKLKKDIKNSEE